MIPNVKTLLGYVFLSGSVFYAILSTLLFLACADALGVVIAVFFAIICAGVGLRLIKRG